MRKHKIGMILEGVEGPVCGQTSTPRIIFDNQRVHPEVPRVGCSSWQTLTVFQASSQPPELKSFDESAYANAKKQTATSLSALPIGQRVETFQALNQAPTPPAKRSNHHVGIKVQHARAPRHSGDSLQLIARFQRRGKQRRTALLPSTCFDSYLRLTCLPSPLARSRSK